MYRLVFTAVITRLSNVFLNQHGGLWTVIRYYIGYSNRLWLKLPLQFGLVYDFYIRFRVGSHAGLNVLISMGKALFFGPKTLQILFKNYF